MEWWSQVAGFRFRIVGTPEPLRTPVQDPLHGGHYAYRVQGFLLEATPLLLIEVFAPSQPLYPLAERACCNYCCIATSLPAPDWGWTTRCNMTVSCACF
jgi:hypothetical protein